MEMLENKTFVRQSTLYSEDELKKIQEAAKKIPVREGWYPRPVPRTRALRYFKNTEFGAMIATSALGVLITALIDTAMAFPSPKPPRYSPRLDFRDRV